MLGTQSLHTSPDVLQYNNQDLHTLRCRCVFSRTFRSSQCLLLAILLFLFEVSRSPDKLLCKNGCFRLALEDCNSENWCDVTCIVRHLVTRQAIEQPLFHNAVGKICSTERVREQFWTWSYKCTLITLGITTNMVDLGDRDNLGSRNKVET
jgi:hypothetical protein